MDKSYPYTFYNFTGNYYEKFIRRNPEFNTEDFENFVVKNNRGDRDWGELREIAKHEILRLAYEYEERRWRFPNVYGEPKE